MWPALLAALSDDGGFTTDQVINIWMTVGTWLAGVATIFAVGVAVWTAVKARQDAADDRRLRDEAVDKQQAAELVSYASNSLSIS